MENKSTINSIKEFEYTAWGMTLFALLFVALGLFVLQKSGGVPFSIPRYLGEVNVMNSAKERLSSLLPLRESIIATRQPDMRTVDQQLAGEALQKPGSAVLEAATESAVAQSPIPSATGIQSKIDAVRRLPPAPANVRALTQDYTTRLSQFSAALSQVSAGERSLESLQGLAGDVAVSGEALSSALGQWSIAMHVGR